MTELPYILKRAQWSCQPPLLTPKRAKLVSHPSTLTSLYKDKTGNLNVLEVEGSGGVGRHWRQDCEEVGRALPHVECERLQEKPLETGALRRGTWSSVLDSTPAELQSLGCHQSPEPRDSSWSESDTSLIIAGEGTCKLPSVPSLAGLGVCISSGTSGHSGGEQASSHL